MQSPKIPSEEHRVKVCRIGQGEKCCIYMAFSAGEGFTCERHNRFLGSAIEARRRGGTMVANSVNCTGAPDFKSSEELPCRNCGMVMEFIEGKCLICEQPYES